MRRTQTVGIKNQQRVINSLLAQVISSCRPHSHPSQTHTVEHDIGAFSFAVRPSKFSALPLRRIRNVEAVACADP